MYLYWPLWYLYELSDIEEYGLIKSFCVWFKPGKVLTYISPVLTYMIFFVVGDYFTIQSFLGTYVSDTAIKLKTGVGMLNIIFQSFYFWIPLADSCYYIDHWYMCDQKSKECSDLNPGWLKNADGSCNRIIICIYYVLYL